MQKTPVKSSQTTQSRILKGVLRKTCGNKKVWWKGQRKNRKCIYWTYLSTFCINDSTNSREWIEVTKNTNRRFLILNHSDLSVIFSSNIYLIVEVKMFWLFDFFFQFGSIYTICSRDCFTDCSPTYVGPWNVVSL